MIDNIFYIPWLVFFSCSQSPSSKSFAGAGTIAQTKRQLLSLERKWLAAEFALDTAYISSLIDATFMVILAGRISNKQQEVDNIYKNHPAIKKFFCDSNLQGIGLYVKCAIYRNYNCPNRTGCHEYLVEQGLYTFYKFYGLHGMAV